MKALITTGLYKGTLCDVDTIDAFGTMTSDERRFRMGEYTTDKDEIIDGLDAIIGTTNAAINKVGNKRHDIHNELMVIYSALLGQTTEFSK